MSDDTEKRKKKILSKIEDAATRLGMGEWDGQKSSAIPRSFGLCSSCKNFEYAQTEFRVIWAACASFGDRCRLSQTEPVRDCTGHEQIGRLPFKELTKMALEIND